MPDTEYADTYGHETVAAEEHGFEECPNCGCDLVAVNDHGTADELHIECAGCGRVRGQPEVPTLTEIEDLRCLAGLIEETTAARGVDVYAVEERGLSATEWAHMTGRDRSTVARNVRRGSE